MTKDNTFYITTPIYYVNDVPHIGHAYTTIAADVLARYWRLRGRDVFFLTGLDEHGQKVQQAAAKAGTDPQVYCDKLAPQFENLWKKLNISNNAFIRTTDDEHKSVVQRYLQQLYDNNLIYKDSYTGWYCTFDERFWTEKDVENGLCPDCKRPVEQLSEHNYFFKMGQYQDRLIEHIKTHPDFIRPESRRNEVLGFLQTQKLGDLSISRPTSRLSWGIELPFDKNYVTYVWFDALVNYISALEYKQPESLVAQFWPADIHLVGKDILTTHAVYWSTMLMALNLALPKTIFAHGWWTVDGEKMSKSRGNVVDPNKMVDEFGVDAFRYFLLREVPFGQDGDFRFHSLIARYNGELANDLGNLLQRTISMIERYFPYGIGYSGDLRENLTLPKTTRNISESCMPTSFPPGLDLDSENGTSTQIGKMHKAVESSLSNIQFHRALEAIWDTIQYGNQYIDKTAPWKLAKNPHDREMLSHVLFQMADLLYETALQLFPFMPQTAQRITRQLGLELDFSSPLLNDHFHEDLEVYGVQIRKGEPLFPRNETDKLQGAKPVSDTPETPRPLPTAATTPAPAAATKPTTPAAPPQITIDEFMKIQLKTAKILSAERVPKSEKLIKLQVSLGTEQRQIVAGIGKKYEPEALIGKTIVIVSNLRPAKLMGIESQGMVLAAGDTDVRGLLTIQEEVDPGTKVK